MLVAVVAVMKERPILFSAPMVRAILDGRKTQTRRVLKMTGRASDALRCAEAPEMIASGYARWFVAGQGWNAWCPYGTVGDRLWVKETIRRVAPVGLGCAWFAADDEPTAIDTWPWKRDVLSAIFLPRGASRITLEIADVRVQRLQEISEDDARAEGVEPGMFGDHRAAFAYLWEQINGKRAPWASTPWIWALTFRRLA